MKNILRDIVLLTALTTACDLPVVPTVLDICDYDSDCLVDSCYTGTCEHSSDGGRACDYSTKRLKECNDNNVCTTDTCVVGSGCVSSKIVYPAYVDPQCRNADYCTDGNECTKDYPTLSGSCVHVPINGCQESKPPAQDTASGSPSKNCDDANVCTKDTLVNGACEHTQYSGNCDDNNPCTSDGCCISATCGASTGAGFCVYKPKNGISALCNDSNPCTDDACAKGYCVGTLVLNKYCDDNNPCTASDYCDLSGKCAGTPSKSPCNDYDECTVGDKCSNGACTHTGTKSCDDSNPCSVDACVPPKGCVNTPVADCTACSDGNACTQECCVSGSCKVTAFVKCDDNNLCTLDACNAETGLCVYKPNNGAKCGTNSTCWDSCCYAD